MPSAGHRAVTGVSDGEGCPGSPLSAAVVTSEPDRLPSIHSSIALAPLANCLSLALGTAPNWPPNFLPSPPWISLLPRNQCLAFLAAD